MKRTIQALAGLFAIPAATRKSVCFCNIAEGTHAGNITMTAGEDIEAQNLLVKAGTSENEIKIAGVGDRPIGVCNDQGAKGDVLNVVLPGSAESTIMCVCSSGASYGDALYTAANGKVSTIAADGAYKVGIALCGCASNGVVEIDPQGFGAKAWQISDCGIFEWTGSSDSATLTNSAIKADDIVFASLAAAAGSEKFVSAIPAEGSVTFKLDANGTQSSTKIAWLIARKN